MELKKCPFCGCDPMVTSGEGYATVICTGCGVCYVEVDKDTAKRKWNTRTEEKK